MINLGLLFSGAPLLNMQKTGITVQSIKAPSLLEIIQGYLISLCLIHSKQANEDTRLQFYLAIRERLWEQHP